MRKRLALWLISAALAITILFGLNWHNERALLSFLHDQYLISGLLLGAFGWFLRSFFLGERRALGSAFLLGPLFSMLARVALSPRTPSPRHHFLIASGWVASALLFILLMVFLGPLLDKWRPKKGEPEGTNARDPFAALRRMDLKKSARFRHVLLGVLAVFGLVLLAQGVRWAYRHSSVTVTAMTPSGALSNRNTVVRVQFSDPVEAKGDLSQALKLDPALPGAVRLEDGRALVFTPMAPLQPATRYTATFSSSVLKTQAKWAIQTSASTSFSTPPLSVVQSRLYYTYDSITGAERDLVAELEFNYPVDLQALRDALTVKRDGQALTAKVEPGSVPTRFYVKAAAPPRGEKGQKLTVALAQDLSCVGCGRPLGSSFEKTMELPAKPEFKVEQVRLHHRPGQSLISVMFSLPVSAGQVKAALTLDPPVPVQVETEYRYAVLTAPFKPNVEYKLHFNAGMKAASGEALKGKYEQTLALSDAPPYVKFGDPGRLIPLKGPETVSVKCMNLDTYQVAVSKVFKNNLASFLNGRRSSYRNYGEEDGEEYGYEREYGGTDNQNSAQVWSGTVTITGGRINEEVETELDFRKWQKQPWKGLFVVDLTGKDDGGADSRWFLATDLGMMAKRSGDDLWVQVLSLSTVAPVPGVTLKLVSQNNQVIQTAVTGPDGRATFKDWKKNPYKFEPLLILAENGGDWSFLRLDRAPLDTSRFDVGGDPYQAKGWEGFLTSDRGLYRPGDTVHLTGVVRKADLSTPMPLPVKLKLFDVSGNEILSRSGQLDADGLSVFDLELPEDASTGQMGANLELENGVFLAHAAFKVEEFIPHKIRVEVYGKGRPVQGKLSYEVSVHHLFGPPAAKLPVKSTVRLVPMEFKPKQWESYRFTDDSRQYPGETLTPPDGVTDAEGRRDLELPVPDSIFPPSMLKAVLYAECLDSGGRPVAANSSLEVHRYAQYLGIKSLKGATVAPGKPVTLRYVAVTPDGEPTRLTGQLLTLKRRIWYSVFRRSGWSERGFQSGYYDELVGTKALDVDGKGEYAFTPDKPGEYTAYLGTEEGVRTSLSLTAEGPGSKPEQDEDQTANLDAPENLALALDQKHYALGAVPKVVVKAPFAGTLILSVEREKVFWVRRVAVQAGPNVVALPPAAAAWAPNVYVTAVMARPPRESMRLMPRMSFGVAPLKIDARAFEIKATFKTPKEVESRGGIPVTLYTGVPGARVVLAAVDEGILDIISFATPNPYDWFYRKRSLDTATWSLFTDVLPELSRRKAVGGDEEDKMVGGVASRAAKHLNPVAAKRVVSYAKFSGLLKADAAGRVVYRFSAKGFHGEARVMALAVKGRRFGGGAWRVQVADAVVLEPSFPRFLAPGDSFDLPLFLSNQTDRPQTLSVKWSLKGPVKMDAGGPASTVLEPKGQGQLNYHGLALADAGTARLKVSVATAEGKTYDDETEMSVRPPNPLTTKVDYGEIAPGAKADLSVPGGFIASGQKVRLSVSASPLLPYLGGLDYLIAYPYGCAEQITSQAFPLLYLKDMGLLTGRFTGRARAVEYYVQSAVDHLERQQREDGSFSYWPHDTVDDPYLSNYVSHFLLEAARQGYEVKAQALERVRKRIGAIRVLGQGGRLDRRAENVERTDSTYLLYLRALAGSPDLESMNALRDKPDAMEKEKAKQRRDFLLSLAYSLSGDKASALKVLPVNQVPNGLVRSLNDDWMSDVKYKSLYLLALAEADPQSPDIPALVKGFGKYLRTNGGFGSTQDNAWALMALAKAVSIQGALNPLKAEWGLAGGEAKPLAGESGLVQDKSLSGKSLFIRNLGAQPAYYHLMAEGTALAPATVAVSDGLKLKREYRDEKGALVNLGSVTQGQIVVVTLRLEALKPLDNVVIVDLLPAGFEVDNPRLKSRGHMDFEPECSLEPSQTDFRDDRVLLFTGEITGEETFSYSVRAVTPGRYTVPALLAEAMYDPDVTARSGGGETLVVAPFKP